MAARKQGGAAKAAGKRPAKRAPAKRRKPAIAASAKRALRQRMRDAFVVELRAMGATWEEVSATDGRTVRSIRRVVDEWRANPPPSLLDTRPMEALEGLLRRQQMAWRIAADTATSTPNEPARVAAVKAMMHADERILEILLAVGHVPRDLSAAREEEAVIELARQLANAMHDVADGKITAAEALRFFESVTAPAVTVDGDAAQIGRPQVVEER